jgi:hypothetical protein
MDPLLLLIEQKRQALQNAKAEVAALIKQIQILEGMQRTVHESVLVKAEENQATPAPPQVQTAHEIQEQSPQDQQKNPKGSLTPVILEVLSDGVVRDMDQMLADVNQRMPNPTTRDSLRSTLGTLRKKGEIESPGYGRYSSQKGESPADFTATNSEGEAFNLQPSPGTGH